MTDVVIISTFAILLGGFYGGVGALIGNMIDPCDNDLLVSCILFWPIILLVHSVRSLVKSLKKIIK